MDVKYEINQIAVTWTHEMACDITSYGIDYSRELEAIVSKMRPIIRKDKILNITKKVKNLKV